MCTHMHFFCLVSRRATGCGKTSIVQEFSKQNFFTLDEVRTVWLEMYHMPLTSSPPPKAFIDMPDSSLHPQSLTCETSWTTFWFQRLLKLDNLMRNKGVTNPFVISDRSPFSAVFYGKNGNLLDREHSAPLPARNNKPVCSHREGAD